MVLTDETIDEILEYMEKSIENLAKDAFENLEIEGGAEGIVDFLQNQFDIRLENILLGKKSSIHHLESRMKNKIIQRKQLVIEKMIKKYKN